jgi:predicted transcriptional regulator
MFIIHGYNKMIMRVNSLVQTGAIELLLYLRGRKQVKWTELLRKAGPSQSALEKARDLLLKEELIYEEDLIEPLRRTFSLTEKGQKVAEYLSMIDGVMVGRSPG